MTDTLKRINELAAIAKTRELTKEETEERDKLRQEFITAFRKNLRNQLDEVEIEYPDKTVISLKDLKNQKKQ